jgi:hypothetical protein
LCMGNDDGEEDNAKPAVDEGRGPHAEDVRARKGEDERDRAKAEAELCGDAAEGINIGRDAGGRSRKEGDMVSKREIVREDERGSESCLHCEINDLVQEHVEGHEPVDLAELAARMAESLVDLVFRAPDEQQAHCSPRP